MHCFIAACFSFMHASSSSYGGDAACCMHASLGVAGLAVAARSCKAEQAARHPPPAPAPYSTSRCSASLVLVLQYAPPAPPRPAPPPPPHHAYY